MSDEDYSDNILERAVSEKRQTRDFDDLQHEIAGVSNGRNSRFINEDHQNGSRSGNRHRMKGQNDLTLLQHLLQNDPGYAAQYQAVMDLLARAERRIEQAIEKTEGEMQQAEQDLDKTMQGANRLPDGTAVFRDADGNVRRADGSLVTGSEADGIVWKSGAASYEEYLKQKKALDQIQKRLDELRRYQVDKLGRYRDRMTDPNNPPTKDDMDRIQKDLEKSLSYGILSKPTYSENTPEPQQQSVGQAIIPTL